MNIRLFLTLFITIILFSQLTLCYDEVELDSFNAQRSSCDRDQHYVITNPNVNLFGNCAKDNVDYCDEYSILDGECVRCSMDYILTVTDGQRGCSYIYTYKIIMSVFIALLVLLVGYLATQFKRSRPSPDDYHKQRDVPAMALYTPHIQSEMDNVIEEEKRIDVNEN